MPCVLKAQTPASNENPAVIFLGDEIWETGSMPFITHTGTKPFSSYLTMNIPHKPVLKISKNIGEIIGRKLKNRGEAHITVITPPEFDNILKPYLSIERIHQIAEQNTIQDASFDIVCIGSGSIVTKTSDKSIEVKQIKEKEETFFLVVTSDDFFKLRKEIGRAFENAGGAKGAFNPEKFQPHITIGFTKRDLHASDGVVKDINSYDPRFKLLIGI